MDALTATVQSVYTALGHSTHPALALSASPVALPGTRVWVTNELPQNDAGGKVYLFLVLGL